MSDRALAIWSSWGLGAVFGAACVMAAEAPLFSVAAPWIMLAGYGLVSMVVSTVPRNGTRS